MGQPWLCYGVRMNEVDARYPIGRFARVDRPIGREERLAAMQVLAELPEQLRNALDGLDHGQIGTPYRKGGWTVRQLVHHLADSHANAYVRVRLALTEEWPGIKPYDQEAWARLHDSQAAPVAWSLDLLESLHARWVMMLQGLQEAEWQRGFVHPESGRTTVETATLTYGWHSRHHVAQIIGLRRERGW
jgi:hypothetical protein